MVKDILLRLQSSESPDKVSFKYQAVSLLYSCDVLALRIKLENYWAVSEIAMSNSVKNG